MAIYGIGAYYEDDVSQDFIKSNLVGVGWNSKEAPGLHQFIKSLKVGDIVYIKSFSSGSHDLFIKAIGFISNDECFEENDLVSCGRNVNWVITNEFSVSKPLEKNNVRNNTMYEEFNQEIQSIIIEKISSGRNLQMSYVTYGNTSNKHVTIHKDGCSQVRKRGGVHQKNQGEYKNHATLQDAEKYAISTKLPIIKCSFCNP